LTQCGQRAVAQTQTIAADDANHVCPLIDMHGGPRERRRRIPQVSGPIQAMHPDLVRFVE
jgi:hypothetical protein